MVEIISKHAIKPPANSSHPRQCRLNSWDLALISLHYIQKGLLFTELPPSIPIPLIVSRLESSLSLALTPFYPLAGRILTDYRYDQDSSGEAAGFHVSIDCNDEGAEFIHAIAANISASDVIYVGNDIPSFLASFFPLNGDITLDGDSSPLLSVQLTELAGGDIFLACSFNHAVGDGTSFWNFFKAWADIERSNYLPLSTPPIHDRWFVRGEIAPIELPFSNHSLHYMHRLLPPILRERFFHFSGNSVAKLKSMANKEAGTEMIAISSFQALSAFIWRAITRARKLQAEQLTSYRLAIENRGKLRPSLPQAYFGNSVYAVEITVKAGDLVEKELGRAAREVNRVVAGHTDEAIREKVRAYESAPTVYKQEMFDCKSVMVSGSPRFDIYGCDFGWGKAAAVRSGPGNKFCGKVTAFPGREGDGSVDLEVSLDPKHMENLLGDAEFLEVVSSC